MNGGPTRGETRPARPARHGRKAPALPALLVIVAVGVAAIAGALLAANLIERRPHGPYLIGAWSFGDDAALHRAVAAGDLDEVSCDWLESRADGSLWAPKAHPGFADEARRSGCRVFITLTDYDESTHRFEPGISAAILATAAARRSHAAAVAAWCRDHGYDGVDVDWEAVSADRRDEYSGFVEELAGQLHDEGRLIAADVYPKTGEPGGWSGPRAQDWRRLGKAVDQFRIMTYNYSGSWSGPGPLSPPAWMSRILTFAESQVDKRKIFMGVGLYGRDWHASQTTDLVWDDVVSIRSADGPRQSRGPSAELQLRFRHDGALHTAYFPDATAVDAKLRMMLAEHPGIRGVFCWMLGQEDPAVWKVMRRRLH